MPMMNLNLSGFLNVFRLLAKPSLCLPHATVPTFGDLPTPLENAFENSPGKPVIKAVVLDKDDCFAYPDTSGIHPPYLVGATTYDRSGKLKTELEAVTGASVLSHRVKKPGCKDEIMAYFESHPETGVTHPSQLAIIGDRLATDMMLANMMGSRGIWIKDGVKPLSQKSVFARVEHRIGPFLMARGFRAPEPQSPFEEP
ncbi:hypothetical protein DL766_002353 [Monosporascus sp. MC13-8B]|uniref:Uncharacterized protein n=1 Tax=Monosporascus cannonballus TaxID=155416 RepID=A0ABY0HK98_9PEZI|nr:hypothetical protein DL762_001600 [Monosporascus cannonballus]RYP00283.1 hypothetical protein DL763_000894 [Monosporascus cannonballus]RYP35700.1 hypothetical protein DL766_002353 [Monosporascus sp. MC13-8B]